MISTDLPPWRALLSSAQHREGRSPSARWLQLATVAADGTPRVRTLVFRGWAEAATLDLLTDARSAKAAELALQPAVELCWLFPKARSQFRLRGCVQVAADETEQRAHHWRNLSAEGRCLWGWPPPGEPYEAGADFPLALDDNTPVPVHFQLLRLAVERVELLDLVPHPHRRLLWCITDHWRELHLNP